MSWVRVVTVVMLLVGNAVCLAEEAAEPSVSERLEALEESVLDLQERVRLLESQAARNYHCAGEYDQAVAATSSYGFTTGAVRTWDGTPFVVDVASAFSNASALLDIVRVEAARVEDALGYQIFVAGSIRPLARLTYRQFYDMDDDGLLIPPDGHINVYCCYDDATGGIGVAYAWRRIIQLHATPSEAVHIILHELYHMFGFVHPGDSPGIVMSTNLMHGAWEDDAGDASFRTRSAPQDLDKLACIFDDRE